ncbi:PI31 proteasome regulator N-terminal-domain-containing protein [Lactarius pseudohatsudake]|nr:PI31 proteasome regulator N-terminal-domain-containing protein [Lactarius pseudohatsudake]
MAPDLLDPAALTASLPNLLPHNRKKLESQQDAITALVHTSFHVLSFRLVAVDDSTPASNILEGVLPDSWNSHGPGSYTLRYRHEQSSLEFVVKVVKLGSRTLINGIAVESDKTASLDIATNDFTSPSFFPFDAQATNPPPLKGYTEGPPATSPSSSNPRRDFPGPRDPARAFPPNRGPWGGDGYLPPMGAPPGARFDPVGPGLGPFPGRTGFGPRGGQPGGGNVGDPDNDEFMPPGADMFM